MNRAKRRATKSEKTRRREKIIAFIVLAIAAVFWLIPIIYMLGTSFKSPTDLATNPGSLFPTKPGEWTLEHYAGFIFRDGAVDKMPVWMLNSLWSTLVTVALTVFIDLLTAYAFVFLKFRGKEVLMKFLLVWMAVPGVIATAPMFAIYATFRNIFSFTNPAATYFYIYFWIVVPGITGIFNMLLMRNFFASIPKEIAESAKSDGANNFRIFFKIVVPLGKSTIMLIVLFTFTGSWNNLIWPQLLLGAENPYWQTVTVALTIYTSGSSSWGANGVAMATCVFALIPSVIIFLFAQNRMIDGLASTGVKG